MLGHLYEYLISHERQNRAQRRCYTFDRLWSPKIIGHWLDARSRNSLLDNVRGVLKNYTAWNIWKSFFERDTLVSRPSSDVDEEGSFGGLAGAEPLLKRETSSQMGRPSR